MEPAKKIEAIKRIVANHQNEKVDGVRVDAFTASAINSVYDNLNEENRARYLTLPIPSMANLAWKLIDAAKGK